MDQDKNKNQGMGQQTGSGQPSTGQSQNVITPGTSGSQLSSDAPVATPGQTNQSVSNPSTSPPNPSDTPKSAGPMGGGKTGLSTDSPLTSGVTSTTPDQSIPGSNQTEQASTQSAPASAQSGGTTSESDSSDTTSDLPSFNRGQDEAPTTVNSTAASLGNVDPGLSAPLENDNPMKKVESAQTDDVSGIQSVAQTPSVAEGTEQQPSSTGLPQDYGNVETQVKTNEMKEEAGSSGNNS